MHLYLIGYRGSGKSTVARRLAQALDMPAVDTDDLLEQTSGMSIRAIFDREGETGFRDREESVIHEVSERPIATVVALGGGAILRTANQQRISSTGNCVWLSAEAEQLFKRITGDETSATRRPNLSDRGGFSEVADILAEREPLYRQLAQKTVITTDKTPDEVVAEILDWANSQAK